MDGTMSYTGRDIADIRRALINKVPELTDKWRDFNESDLGMVILELIAGSQDMQNYYFDTQAFETFLDTAQQPKNIRSLLRTMNYRIPLIGSAKGDVRIEYIDKSNRKIYFPKYTQLACSVSGVKYVVSDTVSLYSSDGYVDLPVMEGEYKEKRVTRRELANNTTALGNISRRIYLNNDAVADRSMEIEHDGSLWKEVDDALLEYNGGKLYSIHKDVDNRVYVLLSVNFLDEMSKDESSELIIRYVVSSGTDGLVDVGYIDTITDGSITSDVKASIKSISNLLPTYGAYDDIDLNRAKVLARRQAQTMGRYITLDDYLNGVETEPYVMKCVVKDWKTLDYVQEPYKVKVWAVDWSGMSLGRQDRESLINKFAEKGVSTISIEVQVVETVNFDIHVKLVLKTNSESEAQRVCSLVEEGIDAYYSLDNMDFGKTISYSLLNSRIRAMSPLIKDLLIESPIEDVVTTEIQFPRLDLVTVEVVKALE